MSVPWQSGAVGTHRAVSIATEAHSSEPPAGTEPSENSAPLHRHQLRGREGGGGKEKGKGRECCSTPVDSLDTHRHTPLYLRVRDCCTLEGLSVAMPSGRMKFSMRWYTLAGEEPELWGVRANGLEDSSSSSYCTDLSWSGLVKS